MKKLAIVSGGSKGIGRAIVTDLLHDGWDVLNLSRSQCDVESVKNLKIDLSDHNLKSVLAKKLTTLLIEYNQISVIHNACAYSAGTVISTSADAIKTAWQVNVLASMCINEVVIPFMKEGSSIIYVGSTLSEMAVANCLPYVVTKHAVVGLMRSTCQDLAGHGVHTCCVCPGFTNTETLKEHLQAGGRSKADIIKNIAMQRIIEPSEMAHMVKCCINSPILNGSVIHANLGNINQ